MKPMIVDNKALRHFGLTLAVAIPLVAGLLIPWIWGLGYPVWPWVVGGLFLFWSLAHPASLRPLFRAWMAMAGVLGWINTRLILGLVYYVIMLPVGLIMRIIRRDPLYRRFEPEATSYRVPSKEPSRENMNRPF